MGRRSKLIENLKQLSPDEGAAIDATMARTTDYEYDLSGRLTAVTLPQVTIDNPQGAGTINVRPRYEYRPGPVWRYVATFHRGRQAQRHH